MSPWFDIELKGCYPTSASHLDWRRPSSNLSDLWVESHVHDKEFPRRIGMFITEGTASNQGETRQNLMGGYQHLSSMGSSLVPGLDKGDDPHRLLFLDIYGRHGVLPKSPSNTISAVFLFIVPLAIFNSSQTHHHFHRSRSPHSPP